MTMWMTIGNSRKFSESSSYGIQKQMPQPRRVSASGRWCKECKDVINVRMGEKTLMELREQILRLIILSPAIYLRN